MNEFLETPANTRKMDTLPALGLKQVLSTWRQGVLDIPVLAEVLSAGKHVISSILTVGLKISTTLSRKVETFDSLRDQVASLQREVSQLRVQKANHQFKSALAGTLNASPPSLLGKRKGADAPVRRKRLASEGRRLLQSITEIAVIKLDGISAGAAGAATSCSSVQGAIDTAALPAKKLSLLLPSCCPMDLAAQNAALNATFLDMGPSSTPRAATTQCRKTVSIAKERFAGGRSAAPSARKRRVSFGGDDVREVQNYIADEDTATFDARLEEIVTFDHAGLDLADAVSAACAAHEPELDPLSAPLDAAETRKLPFGIQDLLAASLRPTQKRRFSLDRMAAKIQSKQASHQPLSFSAADILQVQLRPVPPSAPAARAQAGQQMGLRDAFQAALLAKFSRTMPATPRTPGEESDAEWL